MNVLDEVLLAEANPTLFPKLLDQGLPCRRDVLPNRRLDEHGSISFYEIEDGLRQRPSCPRLTSYWQFAECRFAKTAHTCSEPAHLSACPVPRHDLRNGRLNQTAYALFFFLRDVCEGDLVAWIDARLAAAAGCPLFVSCEREALRR